MTPVDVQPGGHQLSAEQQHQAHHKIKAPDGPRYNITLPTRSRPGAMSNHTGMARVPKLSESISANPARMGNNTGNDVTMFKSMTQSYARPNSLPSALGMDCTSIFG